jgi:multidrug efflux pump subunit AcrB
LVNHQRGLAACSFTRVIGAGGAGVDFPLIQVAGRLAGRTPQLVVVAPTPKPIEVKLFSTDVALLKRKGPELAEQLKQIKGVVDVFDGLVFAGPTLRLKVRSLTAERFGLTAGDRSGRQYRDAGATRIERA